MLETLNFQKCGRRITNAGWAGAKKLVFGPGKVCITKLKQARSWWLAASCTSLVCKSWQSNANYADGGFVHTAT